MYSMEEVVAQKQKNRRQALSCSRKYFVQKSMNQWEGITRHIVTALSAILASHIQKVARQTLMPFRKLHNASLSVVMDLVDTLTDQAMEHCLFMMHRELKSEFTLSKERQHVTYNHALDQLCSGLNIAKKEESQFDENEAIMIMANAIAYYDLAFRRHADIIAMAIEDLLFNEFADRCTIKLLREVNLFKASEDQIGKLMEEDSTVAVKRKEVEMRLKRLQKTAKELRAAVPDDWDEKYDVDALDLTANKRKSTEPVIGGGADYKRIEDAKRKASEEISQGTKSKKKKKKFGLW